MKKIKSTTTKKLAVFLMTSTLAVTSIGCAPIERATKDLNSNVSGGIPRKVLVYSNTGEILREYKGKIDIQYREDGTVLFELDGKRTIIKNAIVIAEEQ